MSSAADQQTSPFQGRLIRLRAIEAEDEAKFHEWMNDPEVTDGLTVRYPLSHASERSWVEAQQSSYGVANFSIEALDDGLLIGSAGLTTAAPENREATLGISIGDKARWDRGYGTDVMQTLCRFGFREMNLHRIQLEVFNTNERAIRVYERVGFRHEGTRREAFFKRGAYRDLYVMGLLEGELLEGFAK